MSLTIELPAPVEQLLNESARRSGTTPDRLAADAVTRSFGDSKGSAKIDAEEQRRRNQPTIDLIESWLEAARQPRGLEEMAAAERDMKDLMRALNASRREAGERLLFPEEETAE